ncbi:MAG: hypothetical protein V4754_12825 [Pseudomonadota bacterium]
MTTETRNAALATLQQLGLITASEYALGLAHAAPRQPGDASDRPDPSATLAWLLECAIVAGDALLATASRLAREAGREAGGEAGGGAGAEAGAQAQGRRDAVLAQALRMVAGRSLRTLLAEGLIGQQAHDAAAATLPAGRVLASPAAALVAMVRTESISRGQLAALSAHIQASGSPAALAILAQANGELGVRQRGRGGAWSAALPPGPRWLWLAGAPLLLLLAGGLWYAMRANAAPGCDARDTGKTVNAMLLMASTASGGRNAPPAPHLQEVHEAGYNAARKTRGCLATLRYADGSGPYAFTIAPNADPQAGGYVMTSAEPELVAARFGRIGVGGDFANQAEPIGRANLEQAFRAGMANLAGAGVKAELARLIGHILPAPRKVVASNGAAAGEREVGEVEPLASCRDLTPDNSATRYACPLLVEWNNPLLVALGRNNALILRGDFTFERAASGQPWHMSERFSDELERAKSVAKHKAEAEADAGQARERQSTEGEAGIGR